MRIDANGLSVPLKNLTQHHLFNYEFVSLNCKWSNLQCYLMTKLCRIISWMWHESIFGRKPIFEQMVGIEYVLESKTVIALVV